jgi:hypothetical protein
VGPATVENISLRCRRHNQYEAELVFVTRTWIRGAGGRFSNKARDFDVRL